MCRIKTTPLWQVSSYLLIVTKRRGLPTRKVDLESWVSGLNQQFAKLPIRLRNWSIRSNRILSSMSTLEERANIMEKKRKKAWYRLKHSTTDTKHWPDIRDKYPNHITMSTPLYKIYHGIPIKPCEYRRVVKYFERKGMTFSYPIKKIKFIENE